PKAASSIRSVCAATSSSGIAISIGLGRRFNRFFPVSKDENQGRTSSPGLEAVLSQLAARADAVKAALVTQACLWGAPWSYFADGLRPGAGRGTNPDSRHWKPSTAFPLT